MFIKKSALAAFVNSAARKIDFYAPTGNAFEKVKFFDEINLSDKTLFSAKKILFPPEEELFSFKNNETRTKTVSKNTVIFGLRPCDLSAFEYLDAFFKDDPYYTKRREKTILVGLQCVSRFKNCFCHLTDSFYSDYYDALLVEEAGGFFIDVKTDAARKLFKPAKRLMERGGGKELLSRIKNKLAEKDLEINDAVIDSFAKDCFSCCACTSVCPTCTCFDILDKLDELNRGKRVRVWDSCQLQNFTRVAGGFIFRKERLDRINQRIYCKFDYSKKRFGRMSCVGCGRCIDVCNKSINIFEVLGNEKPLRC
ncbi:4Fe-4S dicluster domain-containing protein [Candidatus Micrarchaeota archaeon]|nr:4Fe-4S dicluster domain-containing protein [Candidatus Micrarchaeota archaeon]